jgi:uncharacterized membrane protein
MARRTDERGGVTVMVAILMTALLGVASFALDLGLQRVGAQDMQAVSDVVALDMARMIDGRTASAISSDSTWTTSLSESVARNGDALGAEPTVTAELGTLDDLTGEFAPVADTDVPNAVKVTAASSVDYVLQTGKGSVSRSAIARAMKSACFSLGSFAARFRSGDSVLIESLLAPMNAFLRPQVDLDAISYQGLATATASLDEIAADASVGTVHELLGAQVTAGQLIQATIAALNRQSPQNSVAITALNGILNGSANLSTPIMLTDVVSVAPTDAAALATKLNVLDLVTGAVLVADGQHAVSVPNLSAGIGNLAPVSSSLHVIERAQTACGPVGSPEAFAETSQIKGEITMKLQLPTINGVSGIQGVLHTPESGVRIQIDLGNGDGRLVSPGPFCNAGTADSPDELNVSVRSGLATFRIDTALHFAGKVEIPVFSLLGVQIGTQLVDVTFDQVATADLAMPDSTATANLKVPPNDTVPVSTGSSSPLGNFTVATVATNVVAKISGVTVTDPATLGLVSAALEPVTAQLAVNTSVVGPLNSLVASVNDLMTPIRTLLGLTVSGADVLAVGRPTCNGSVLRG